MEYARIIAITGLPGLFELISSKADGGIVRSLEDKTTRFVSSRVHQFSHLESIEVYTTRYNVNLVEVLQAMKGSSETLPDEKNAGELKSYFEKVFPELDHGRVYSSDLKKMVKWFSILTSNEVELKLSEPEVTEEDAEEEEPETEAADDAPKKSKEKTETAEKAAPKKSAAKEKKEEPKKEAPVKKPAAKAAKEEKEEKETKKAAPKKSAPKKDDKKPASKAAPKKSAGKK